MFAQKKKDLVMALLAQYISCIISPFLASIFLSFKRNELQYNSTLFSPQKN